MKRTKIIATIGPVTASKEKIKQLIESGMNVARINFSHGDHVSNGKLINYVKELRDEMKLPIGIMADLQGPRIRTVTRGEIEIKKGEKIGIFDTPSSLEPRADSKFSAKGQSWPEADQPQNLKFIGLDWPGIIANIEVGNDILIEDGLLKINVVKKNKKYLICKVMDGGTVRNNKGVNIPDARLKMSAITKKDEKDLKFALEQGIDFVALSFVSDSREILKAREKLKRFLGRSKNIPHIVAKIERKEAIKNILEIINVSDAIMVARGDLGIEMDESRVVIYQKEIIACCLRHARPVIVATQMLNSMIENPRPTRAEVSDVSNAVIDHTDCVMLSGETASGRYPVQAMKVMRDIIKNTELSSFDVLEHGFLRDKKHSVSAAIAHASHELQKDTKSKAIVAASVSGFSARMIARHRPEVPIYVMTNNEHTHNQLSLVWGAQSFVLPECKTLDELIDKSLETLKNREFIKTKDKIIIVAGRPNIVKEHMSLVKAEEVR